MLHVPAFSPTTYRDEVPDLVDPFSPAVSRARAALVEADAALAPFVAAEEAAGAAFGPLFRVDAMGERVPATGVAYAAFDEARVDLARAEAATRVAASAYDRARVELLEAGHAAASDPDVVAAAYAAYDEAEAHAAASWASARSALAARDELAAIIGVADVGIGSLPSAGYWRHRPFGATTTLADTDALFAPAHRIEATS